MSYKPAPIDTSQVTLTGEVAGIVEELARSTHDVWAARRLRDGWTYGPRRDDALKQHPGLVPYAELSESEKEYDRATAGETVKALLALGYRIEIPAAAGAESDDLATEAAVRVLRDPAALNLSTLIALWDSKSVECWRRTPEVPRRIAERMLAAGEPLLAFDIVSAALEGAAHAHDPAAEPQRVRLRQLLALALIRSGAAERAEAVLERLVAEGHSDEETVGMLARVHKDRWTEATAPHEKKRYLQTAFELYTKGGGYWTRINAAALAVFLGRRARARALAGEVRDLCLRDLEAAAVGSDEYWLRATLGEAALIRNEIDDSERWYRSAAEHAARRHADLSTTRRQARRLAVALGLPTERVDACLPVPAVAVFGGGSRLAGAEDEGSGPRVVDSAGFFYATLGSSEDVELARAVLGLGKELNVVIPLPREEYVRSMRARLPDGEAMSRLERALAGATRIVVATQYGGRDGFVADEYASLLRDGLALLRARSLDAEVIYMSAPNADAGFGGAGRRPLRPPAGGAPNPRGRLGAATGNLSLELRAILFADVVGYSKLTEDEIPQFLTYFMGAVAGLLRGRTHAPLTKNTWGDALYLVFRSVEDAFHVALDLRDCVLSTRWEEVGLRRDLNLRIGLHAGPVFSCVDPVIRKPSYVGAHVSQAARIEPITPPGYVYASQPFAALAVAQRVPGFACEYVGTIPLAKQYGLLPMYHVRWAGGPRGPKRSRRASR